MTRVYLKTMLFVFIYLFVMISCSFNEEDLLKQDSALKADLEQEYASQLDKLNQALEELKIKLDVPQDELLFIEKYVVFETCKDAIFARFKQVGTSYVSALQVYQSHISKVGSAAMYTILRHDVELNATRAYALRLLKAFKELQVNGLAVEELASDSKWQEAMGKFVDLQMYNDLLNEALPEALPPAQKEEIKATISREVSKKRMIEGVSYVLLILIQVIVIFIVNHFMKNPSMHSVSENESGAGSHSGHHASSHSGHHAFHHSGPHSVSQSGNHGVSQYGHHANIYYASQIASPANANHVLSYYPDFDNIPTAPPVKKPAPKKNEASTNINIYGRLTDPLPNQQLAIKRRSPHRIKIKRPPVNNSTNTTEKETSIIK